MFFKNKFINLYFNVNNARKKLTKSHKILIVEDHVNTGKYFERLLCSNGLYATAVTNAKDALNLLKKDKYSIVLTDWIMPEIDGIELIKKARNVLSYKPIIFMITSKISRQAQNLAMEVGADAYFFKPVDKDLLLKQIDESIKKLEAEPHTTTYLTDSSIDVLPDFPAIVIAISTGGPPTLVDFFKEIPRKFDGVFYIVQHGPAWMLESLCSRLAELTEHSVIIPEDGTPSRSGRIYLAPGNKHMIIEPDNLMIMLDDGPKINFCKPAADPLFISASRCFGKYCIGVILTGLGSDGTGGAAQILAGKGKLFIQEPSTAIAPSMPNSAVSAGLNAEILDVSSIGRMVSSRMYSMYAGLNKMKQTVKD